MVKERSELQMQLTATPPPVKKAFHLPAHSKSSPSLLHFWEKRCRIQSQSNTGELVQRAERKYSKLRPFYLMRIMPP